MYKTDTEVEMSAPHAAYGRPFFNPNSWASDKIAAQEQSTLHAMAAAAAATTTTIAWKSEWQLK